MNGPLPNWLDVLAAPASRLYGAVVKFRNHLYDRGWKVQRMPLPVIAVGNLTVGGTGKTPLVTWIVRQLREAGHCPAIAMRGYGSADPSRADEALEYRERLGDIEIIVGPDRCKGVLEYVAHGGKADCVVLDDAFQHRRIHRDLDIVVIDLLRDAFTQRMLPLGWLREPVSGLRRADAIVVSHAERSDPAFSAKVAAAAGEEPLAWTAHRWRSLQVHDADGERQEGLDWLTGRSAAVRLGIGHPGPVIEALVRLGCRVARHLPAGDHEPFSAGEVVQLTAAARNVDAIVMTLKDWVKARGVVDMSALACPIVVPDLELEMVAGSDALQAAILGAVAVRCVGEEPA